MLGDRRSPDHCLSVDIGALAQAVQALAGHCVTGNHHHFAFGLDPETHGGMDRALVGRRCDHPKPSRLVDQSFGDLMRLHLRLVLQVSVVLHAVVHVGVEHVQGGLGKPLEAQRPISQQRPRILAGDPPGGNHIVVVRGVVRRSGTVLWKTMTGNVLFALASAGFQA